jgi:hypothetical protein
MADVKFVRIMDGRGVGGGPFAWARFRMYTVQWVIRKLLRIQDTLSLSPGLKNNLNWALKLSSLSSFIINSNPATWYYRPSIRHCKSCTNERTYTYAHRRSHILTHTNAHTHTHIHTQRNVASYLQKFIGYTHIYVYTYTILKTCSLPYLYLPPRSNCDHRYGTGPFVRSWQSLSWSEFSAIYRTKRLNTFAPSGLEHIVNQVSLARILLFK